MIHNKINLISPDCPRLSAVQNYGLKHHFIFILRIIDKNNGKVLLTYKRFQRLIKHMPLPHRPCPPIDRTIVGNAKTPIAEDHDEVFGVPSLDELGELCTVVWSS